MHETAVLTSPYVLNRINVPAKLIMYKEVKLTKAKSVFPTDDSLLKMLYLAMMDITKKWTGRRQDWSLIHAQMAIYFAERMPE